MDYGIDISHWNTVDDWNAVRGNNITFASIKATQGDYFTDDAFPRNADGAHTAGIRRGAYHFADPNVPVSRNVRHFVGHARGRGAFDIGAFVPMLDVEDSSGSGVHWDPHTANWFIREFIREFRDATSVAPIAIYANLSMWETMLRPDEWADDQVFLWIALYNGDPGNVRGYKHDRAALHQHTNRGHVPGVRGFVDRNVTLPGFGLANLTVGTSTPPPDPGPPPPPQPSPGGWVDYRVQPGDTLSEIAAERGTTVAELATVNGIANRNLIYAGQVIRVPAAHRDQSTRQYRIQPGDTLSEIAHQFRTSVDAIAELNGITNPNLIYAGQWLDIPEGDAPSPPPRAYTVQPGDTLSEIAQQLGVTVDHLVNRNGIANPNLIHPGQVIHY